MTHSTKLVSALRSLADCVEEATIIQYGQALRTRNERERSAPRTMTHLSQATTDPRIQSLMKPGHVTALYVTLDLREAASDCTDDIIDRERMVSLMERATDLELPLSEGIINLAIVRLIAAYRRTYKNGRLRRH